MDNLGNNKKYILGDCYQIASKKLTLQYEESNSFECLGQVRILHTEPNVLSGLHFSSNSDLFASCVLGKVLFVIVDLRPESPAYLESKWIEIASDEASQLFIPAFYAFGYFCSSNSIIYLTENSNTQIHGLNIKDKILNLDIPFCNYLQSQLDLAKPSLEEIGSLIAEKKINDVYKKILKATNGFKSLASFEKRVLVTGGAGFIGSHVAVLLTKKYPTYKIVVLDKLEECSNMKNLNEIKNRPNYLFIKEDICNFENLENLFSEFKFEYVLHFAAQTHVDISLVCPLKFSKTNVLGTHNLLECCRLNGIEKFVHVSTDEVYGTTDKVPNINQPLDPTNPYACSKLAAENIIKAYQKCYKLPIVITRGNNAYGPHQYVEKVIPKFITRLLKNKKCCIYENCYESERDFLYVSDTAEAFDLVLHKGMPGEVYNIGASQSVNIVELARKIIFLMKKAPEGEEENWIELVQGRLLNDERYRIDSSRLIQLGWKPKIDFNQGLIKTIEWYKENQNYWENGDQAIDLFCEKINPNL